MHMKSILTFTLLIALFFTACESQKEKSVKAYEEGVTISKEADAAMKNGDSKGAGDLYSKANTAYNKSLELDSTNMSARSAIASNHYKNKDYTAAIEWYAKANTLEGEKAPNYREMGLIKISMDELNEGKEYLEKSVALDHSEENRKEIINGLLAVGDNKFKEGTNLKTQGNVDAAKKQQNYAMSVLMLAYYLDNTRKDVAGTIAKYADEVGDYTVKVQYTKLSQQ